jgi:DNA-directed RNA polymerase subunit RPC12/RpoP
VERQTLDSIRTPGNHITGLAFRNAMSEKDSQMNRTKVYVWKLTDLGPNRLGVQCPWCDHKMIVNKRAWLPTKKNPFFMRSCSYCGHKVAIPEAYCVKTHH